MSLRVHTWVTHLRAEDALTLIELLDQVREVLARGYEADIRAMLKEATAAQVCRYADGEDEPF